MYFLGDADVGLFFLIHIMFMVYGVIWFGFVVGGGKFYVADFLSFRQCSKLKMMTSQPGCHRPHYIPPLDIVVLMCTDHQKIITATQRTYLLTHHYIDIAAKGARGRSPRRIL